MSSIVRCSRSEYIAYVFWSPTRQRGHDIRTSTLFTMESSPELPRIEKAEVARLLRYVDLTYCEYLQKAR
jgi:hypothetical protein